jgi:chromosome segregation ATPase
MDFSFLFKAETWGAVFGLGSAVLGGWTLFTAKRKKTETKNEVDKQLSDTVTPILQHVEENRIALEGLKALIDEVQSERDYYKTALYNEREERKNEMAALKAEIAKIKQERTAETLENQATIQQLQTELDRVKTQLNATLVLNEEYLAENKQLKARVDKRGTGELRGESNDTN